MGSLFRSESMTLCQLFLQNEAAYNTISELGELGLVQFRDLNPGVNAFQRKFIHEVRRCDEMERILRYVEKEIKKEEIPILDVDDFVPAPPAREMIDMESSFDNLENDLKEVMASGDALRKTFLELTELRHTLLKTQQFFHQTETTAGAFADEAHLMRASVSTTEVHGKHGSLQLSFVAGVINRERLGLFERMLWRVCRGNVYMRSSEIETPLADPIYPEEVVHKTAFIIFFQGEQLRMRVKKICEGCRATVYPCPEEAEERSKLIVDAGKRIDDVNTVMLQTVDHRHRILVTSARSIKTWFAKVRKIKAIYVTLNLFNFDVTQRCLIGECWCPTEDLVRIRSALSRGTDKSGSAVPSILNEIVSSEDPPTFQRTNKFTSGFQNIVDAYGVANYKEVNPAPFTIITFPFLFAVMFGDAGHGLIMALFAVFLVVREDRIIAMKSRNEIFLTFFNGRYIILLMGFFSVYTGLMYNDVFAKSVNLFGSGLRIGDYDYGQHEVRNENSSNTKITLDPAKHFLRDPYWFGLDPVWQTSSNKILFLNSYKMKLSVILGVGQMLFGVALSLYNHTYFRKSINIFCEFIPQVIFLMAIFGYMNILIIAKWLVYDSSVSGRAPSILIVLINMFMGKEEPMPMYDGQSILQPVLVVLAIICIPWMLAIKPWILYREAKRNGLIKPKVKTPRKASVRSPSSASNPGNGSVSQMNNKDDQMMGSTTSIPIEGPSTSDEDEKEGFDLGDCIIHQAIHTIEYCLGSISHTASYLRLWALSLAHAQLSEVLWNMVMQKGLMMGGIAGGVAMWVVFAFWAILTVSVLLLMEGLSAFLHALRLHWVEFQSKFYVGAGVAFAPFSFKVILEEEEINAE